MFESLKLKRSFGEQITSVEVRETGRRRESERSMDMVSLSCHEKLIEEKKMVKNLAGFKLSPFLKVPLI